MEVKLKILRLLLVIVFLLLSSKVYPALKLGTEGKLSPVNPEDSEILKIINKKIPDKFKSYSVVLLKELNIYELEDSINQSQKDPKNKELTYKNIYSHLKYVQKETGKNSGRGFGDYSLTFEPLREDAEIIEARRIKSDGSFLRVKNEDIKYESITTDPRAATYRNLYQKAFSIKDIQKGDFVEYSDQLRSFKKMGPYGYGRKYWFGNSDYPVLDEELCFIANKTIPISFNLIDRKKIVKREDTELANGKRKYCFYARNQEPEILEPSTPVRVYDQPLLYVTTWKNWDDYATWLAAKYEGKFEPDRAIKSLVDKLTKGFAKKEDKVREIFHWIEKNVHYVQVYLDFDSDWIPTAAPEIFIRKYGDCKDKATLLISMLRVIGVKAWPTDISTTSSVLADLDFPMMYQFNHMITYIEDLDIYLDPVGSDMPFPHLLTMDRDRNVMVLKQDRLIRGRTPWENQQVFERDVTRKIRVVVPPSDSGMPELKKSGSYTFKGGDASDWYDKAKKSKAEMDEYMKNEFVGSDGVLEGYKFFTKLDDFNTPVKLECRLSELLEDVSYKGSKLSFIMLPSFLNFPYYNDFYKYKARKYPYKWDTSKYWRIERNLIEVPKGFKVQNLPEDVAYDEPDGAFEYSGRYKMEGETIKVEEVYKLKKPILELAEFKAVQEILKKFSSRLNNRIVLIAE
jgi:hypothetical protein